MTTKPSGSGTGNAMVEEDNDEARRRREQLNRRPSYRMILKDLETADKTIKKESDETPPLSSEPSPLQVNIPNAMLPPQQNHGPQTSIAQPRITAVTTSSGSSPYGSPLGTTLLGSNPSTLIHSFPHLNGDLPGIDFAAAIAAASGPKPNNHTLVSVPQNGLGVVPGPSGIVMPPQPPPQTQQLNVPSSQPMNIEGSSGVLGHMAHNKPLGLDTSFGDYNEWNNSTLMSGYSSSPSPTSMRMGGGPMHGEEETNRKRQVRLLKNREAAKECRRKKKEYVKCLENRVSVLENQNKALIEELKTLKELYCRKEKTDM